MGNHLFYINTLQYNYLFQLLVTATWPTLRCLHRTRISAQVIIRIQFATRLLLTLFVVAIHQTVIHIPDHWLLPARNVKLLTGGHRHQELWLNGHNADPLIVEELFNRSDNRLVRLWERFV